MAAIHDLIAQIGDERLRERLTAEWAEARGLARFAEQHGALFGRIQMIRKRKVSGGAEQFVRLKVKKHKAIQKLLLVTQPAQLDALFDGVQRCSRKY